MAEGCQLPAWTETETKMQGENTDELPEVSCAFVPNVCLTELWAKPNRKNHRSLALPNILWSPEARGLNYETRVVCEEGWKGLFQVRRQRQHCWISVACWGARQPPSWSLERTSEVIQQLVSLSIKVRWSTNSLITVLTRRRGKHSVEFAESELYFLISHILSSL